MSAAIEFENISKQYRLGVVSTGTLRHDLNRWWVTKVLGREDPYLKIGETNDRSTKGTSDYVWALKDINFSVEQGDVVGIIGKNGAGKSTLLKLLSRVTAPTTGMIRAKGRIASLLEVGTGFHGEMTGRENIYLNGAILGMTKAEIDRKLDEIVDFSGCERYIDTPVKRYSSGMTVRLGFAVAAHLDPEILVVDEVLAVGDAEFQKKAIGKMQDVSKGEGRTVLFVSHNMNSIKKLCRHGIILKNGLIDFMGDVDDVVEKYLVDQQFRSSTEISLLKDREGDGQLTFTDVKFWGSDGVERIVYRVGEEMNIRVFFDAKENFLNAKTRKIDFSISDMLGNQVTWLSTSLYTNSFDCSKNYVTFKIPKIMLSEGNYNLNLYAEYDNNMADWIQNVGAFSMEYINYFGTGTPYKKRGNVVTDFELA